MLLSAAGMVVLTQIAVTSGYVSGVLPAVLILGLGLGLIFAHAINTATAGIAREDSGVASALVNTMQQVGGSIGTAALSTVALSATATYLIGRDPGTQTEAVAATYGYTTAFGVSAGLLVLGCALAIVLLPSRRRLATSGSGRRNPSCTRPSARPPVLSSTTLGRRMISIDSRRVGNPGVRTPQNAITRADGKVTG